MKALILTLFFLLLIHVAQSQQDQKKYAAERVMNWNAKAGGNVTNIINGFDERVSETTGNVYLDEEWHSGNIYLKSGHNIKNLSLRYNLYSNYLEINYNGKIKVLDVNKLEKFELVGPEYIKVYKSASLYQLKDTPLLGILEEMVPGHFSLVKKIDLKIKKPTYIEAFDVGSKNTKINKDSKLYISNNGNLYKIYRKKNYTIFNNHIDQLKKFIEKNKLKFKREKDAIKILEFYNSLL